MNAHKGSVVKQSGNDVERRLSQKVLFQPNMRVFLQYSVKYTGNSAYKKVQAHFRLFKFTSDRFHQCALDFYLADY